MIQFLQVKKFNIIIILLGLFTLYKMPINLISDTNLKKEILYVECTEIEVIPGFNGGMTLNNYIICNKDDISKLMEILNQKITRKIKFINNTKSYTRKLYIYKFEINYKDNSKFIFKIDNFDYDISLKNENNFIEKKFPFYKLCGENNNTKLFFNLIQNYFIENER